MLLQFEFSQIHFFVFGTVISDNVRIVQDRSNKSNINSFQRFTVEFEFNFLITFTLNQTFPQYIQFVLAKNNPEKTIDQDINGNVLRRAVHFP